MPLEATVALAVVAETAPIAQTAIRVRRLSFDLIICHAPESAKIANIRNIAQKEKANKIRVV